jgi:hypothetical protein
LDVAHLGENQGGVGPNPHLQQRDLGRREIPRSGDGRAREARRAGRRAAIELRARPQSIEKRPVIGVELLDAVLVRQRGIGHRRRPIRMRHHRGEDDADIDAQGLLAGRERRARLIVGGECLLHPQIEPPQIGELAPRLGQIRIGAMRCGGKLARGALGVGHRLVGAAQRGQRHGVAPANQAVAAAVLALGIEHPLEAGGGSDVVALLEGGLRGVEYLLAGLGQRRGRGLEQQGRDRQHHHSSSSPAPCERSSQDGRAIKRGWVHC